VINESQNQQQEQHFKKLKKKMCRLIAFFFISPVEASNKKQPSDSVFGFVFAKNSRLILVLLNKFYFNFYQKFLKIFVYERGIYNLCDYRIMRIMRTMRMM